MSHTVAVILAGLCRSIAKILKIEFMTSNMIINQQVVSPVVHPMSQLQHQVRSLVNSNVLKPTDSLWKIAFLYGDDWAHWKQELQEYDFSMQDPVEMLLDVEVWDDD